MKSIFFLVMFYVCFLDADSFQHSISERQAFCIEKIIKSLGQKSTGTLMFNAIQLKSYGKEIDPVPPLEFLYYVYKRDHLYNNMKKIRNRYFQWNAFISGFRDKCNKPEVYAGILENLEEFSEAIGVSFDDLSMYATHRDWKELVIYLLKRR